MRCILLTQRTHTHTRPLVAVVSSRGELTVSGCAGRKHRKDLVREAAAAAVETLSPSSPLLGRDSSLPDRSFLGRRTCM